MFTKLFWKDALERAVSTAAQAVLIVTGLSEEALGVINQGITLEVVLYAAGAGAALSILKALAARQFTSGNSASLVVDNVKEKK